MGWFANAVTWFRLGDAYRAYVFTQDTGAEFPRTIGTVLAERVLDVVMVFLLLANGRTGRLRRRGRGRQSRCSWA